MSKHCIVRETKLDVQGTQATWELTATVHYAEPHGAIPCTPYRWGFK